MIQHLVDAGFPVFLPRPCNLLLSPLRWHFRRGPTHGAVYLVTASRCDPCTTRRTPESEPDWFTAECLFGGSPIVGQQPESCMSTQECDYGTCLEGTMEGWYQPTRYFSPPVQPFALTTTTGVGGGWPAHGAVLPSTNLRFTLPEGRIRRCQISDG